MKIQFSVFTLGLSLFTAPLAASGAAGSGDESFKVEVDRFADVAILRYRAAGFEQLPLQQKKLAYYLAQAGLEGRDIFYDQKHRHGLLIRKTLEAILSSSNRDKTGEPWRQFEVYAKRFFVANGIHHQHDASKILPECSPEYFAELLRNTDRSKLPLGGRSLEDFTRMLTPILFDPKVDPKLVDLSANIDNVKASAVNFYEGVTEEEVNELYAKLKESSTNKLLSFGLNSKVVKEHGRAAERKWMVGGMYDAAIRRIVGWLEKAVEVAENEQQKKHLRELIAFYQTGDLARFDQHCIEWVKETEGRIDVVNGFIEVYQDPLQMKGSFESVVSMKDLEASRRIATIGAQAQWFEDHAPLMAEHKKKNVVGISAKVITVLSESGDAAPSTPIGINLPNPNWIREKHGSKSVTLGNIIDAYNHVRSRSPATEEFSVSPEIAARIKKHGPLGSVLHTDMHEVIGHASGRLNEGVETPDKTLQTYAGTLEEARADLVALYYALDSKLVEMGVMPSLEVGHAQYDNYVMNGLMTQLYRVKAGDNLEQTHMRNRQLNCAWAMEQGAKDKVIERLQRDGKTYFKINDYQKLRQLWGRLLREIQRIKSEGDYAAGRDLVEKYGVKVDQELRSEVHARYQKLNVAANFAFIQPLLVPVMRDGEIADVRIEYPEDFLGQMLEFGERYGSLPVRN